MTIPIERTCPECGQPVHAGQVRHPECFRKHLDELLNPPARRTS